MRRIIIFAFAILACACLPDDLRSDRDTTFIIAKAAAPLSLDPAVFATANDYPVQELVYEQLFTLAPESAEGVIGELAERWAFSDDGLVLDITLKSGRFFESGRAVTANDVVFSLRRVQRMGRWSSAYLAWLKSVEATGELSVRITLNRPYRPALQMLALTAASVLDSQQVLAEGDDQDAIGFLSRRSAGSGPYRISEVTLDGTVVLEPNPAAAPPLFYDRVEFRVLPDEGVRRLLLERGDIDFTDLVPSAFIDRYDALPGVDVLTGRAGTSLSFLSLNTRNGPMSDARMRKAVVAAIDFDGLINNVLKGAAEQPGGYIPEAANGWRSTAGARPARDLAEARALMSAAGYQGEDIELATYQIGPVGEFLQSNLREAGLNVRMVRRDAGAVADMKRDARFDMIYEGWLLETPNPAPMLEALFSSRNLAGGLNASGLDDPRIDARIDQALAVENEAERSEIMAEIDALLREQRPVAMIFSALPVAAFRNDLRGVRLDPFKPYYQPVHTYPPRAGNRP